MTSGGTGEGPRDPEASDRKRVFPKPVESDRNAREPPEAYRQSSNAFKMTNSPEEKRRSQELSNSASSVPASHQQNLKMKELQENIQLRAKLNDKKEILKQLEESIRRYQTDIEIVNSRKAYQIF
jgi:nitric oxide reductase activation protein